MHYTDFLAAYGSSIAVALLFILTAYISRRSRPNLDHIPTIGPSGPLLSYIGAIRFLFDAQRILQEGYDKYGGAPFKVATLNRWLVVIGGAARLEELRRVPETLLSFPHAADEMVQIPYTLGAGITADPYHVPIVSAQLTRSLPMLIPILHDEATAALSDKLNLQGNEWRTVPALDAVTDVVCRTANRAFVGRELCRNEDFIALNVRFTKDVVKGAIIVSMFPTFLRPIAARFFTHLRGGISRARKHLRPIIEERQHNIDVGGKDYVGKPNDMLAWLMDEATGEQRTMRDFVLRILAINFAAVHTTSMSFTHALYYLAANPEYAQLLRQEVEAAVRKDGWTKDGLGNMRLLDSFLKESMRVSGIRALSMMRKVLAPVTLADGTQLPVGTLVFAAAGPTHADERRYAKAGEFDAARFASARPGQGLVAAGTDFLAWGYGRRTCPGRFFASALSKVLLGHILMAYDVRLPGAGTRPADRWIEDNCLPNLAAEVLFRRRDGH